MCTSSKKGELGIEGNKRNCKDYEASHENSIAKISNLLFAIGTVAAVCVRTSTLCCENVDIF